MSSVVISGDTSGAITLAAPAVSGTNTATLPAATGTVIVSGNMPAFSAYQSSAQTISSANTFTKLQFQSIEFDTASAFDNTTNYRFKPLVAGYYMLTGFFTVSGAVLTDTYIALYKNGSAFKYGLDSYNNENTGSTWLVYANGTTDYFELYGLVSVAKTLAAAASNVYFTGAMIRAA